MVEQISRRLFFKRLTAAGTLGALAITGTGKLAKAATAGGDKATLIDLSKCNGCKGETIPYCVSACRQKNLGRFPEPVKPIKPYWPQPKFEDWSEQRDVINRLTPYNWTFVEKVVINNEEVFVPRRCMHCNHPTCMKLCPFGAIEKESSGAVEIDAGLCMGGAKCRDVCPWGIPQRQAGVGLYMKLVPDLAGGGVMYKCDFCSERQKEGLLPACVGACPKGAISLGNREEILQQAHRRAKEIGGEIYGEKENGGTATIYVSRVPFKEIHAAISQAKKQNGDSKPGRPGMPVDVNNYLNSVDGMMKAALIAPFAGAVSAGIIAFRTLQSGNGRSEQNNVHTTNQHPESE